ncbi:MAG TPA: hypothetical protein VLC92_11315 [Rhodocyclaceae bacterium]|nr:hypothetical protein [Rhodocyclaceae bacterium]
MTPTKPEQIASPEPVTMSEARRKLIRAGLATGPVIATLASPSVLAVPCIAPSIPGSVAQSQATQVGDCELGFTSAQWTSNLANLSYTGPGAGLRNQNFHDVFVQKGTSPATRMYTTTGVAKPLTLLQVLQDPTRDVAREFVAAYLNIRTKNIQFPVGGVKSQQASLQAIVEIWNDWALKGSYTPYATAKPWFGDKIKYYLAHFVPSSVA